MMALHPLCFPVGTILQRLAGPIFLLVAALGAIGCARLPDDRLRSVTAPGKPIVMPATSVWHHTGVWLHRGRSYEITAGPASDGRGGDYRDWFVRCGPDGPESGCGRLLMGAARDGRSSWKPAHWLGMGAIRGLRVLTDAHGRKGHFLTLIGTVGEDDSPGRAFVIGSHCRIAAPATGELVVFANDWPGGDGTVGDDRFRGSKTYANNHGALRVCVRKVRSR